MNQVHTPMLHTKPRAAASQTWVVFCLFVWFWFFGVCFILFFLRLEFYGNHFYQPKRCSRYKRKSLLWEVGIQVLKSSYTAFTGSWIKKPSSRDSVWQYGNCTTMSTLQSWFLTGLARWLWYITSHFELYLRLNHCSDFSDPFHTYLSMQTQEGSNYDWVNWVTANHIMALNYIPASQLLPQAPNPTFAWSWPIQACG